MKHNVETLWMGKMQFNALVDDHTIIMDAPVRSGGEDNGPIPKPLLLTALSGCTGMDVIGLLKRMNITPSSFEVKVSAEVSKDRPIRYTSAHIDYVFEGNEEDKNRFVEVVAQSQENYCGVSFMLKKAFPITWTVMANGAEIFSNKLSNSNAA